MALPDKKVSVFIPVKNEEQNIAHCLETLRDWADEVFVIDSQSADRTVEIAERLGAIVHQFHFDGKTKKDDWAIENLPFRNEWVFYIDADERIPPELGREIVETVNGPNAKDGYYVNRRLIFMGRWVKHAGLYPSWTLRLFKHRLGRYEKVEMKGKMRRDSKVHEHLILDGTVGYLRNDMLHRDMRDLYRYIERHNQYSDWDAEVYLNYRQEPLRFDGHLHGSVRVKRFVKRLWVRLPLRPLLRFLYMYLARGGMLDGKAGLHYCLLRAVHEYHISVKLKERMKASEWFEPETK
jgi:glycosyltransferase involved in cell wall biosynthesis